MKKINIGAIKIMDSFKEQLVTRKPDNTVFIKRALIFVAAVFVSILLFKLLGVMSLILIALLFWGAYFLIKNFDAEYEYICTKGDLDIDKITAKSRRKRLISVNLKSVEDFGLANGKSFCKKYSTVDTTSGDVDDESYFILCKDSKYGMCYILITPDDDMLEIIKTYLPKTIRR